MSKNSLYGVQEKDDSISMVEETERNEMEEEERERKRSSRTPTANYQYRDYTHAKDQGPLNMRGGEGTLPAGHERRDGILPRAQHHVKTRSERLSEGARKVGQGLKRAYEYEPSEGTKHTIRKSVQGVRDELGAAGRQYTGGRRYRTRTRGDDVLGLGDLSGYAEMFNPAGTLSPRKSRGGKGIRNRPHRLEESIGYDPSDPFGLGGWGGGHGGSDSYGSDFSAYAEMFNPFSDFGRRKTR